MLGCKGLKAFEFSVKGREELKTSKYEKGFQLKARVAL